VLRAEAAAVLAAGYSVIADAAFLRPEERRHIAEVAQTAGVPFTGIWLDAPAELLARRLEARHDDASDADVAALRLQTGWDLGAIDWQRVDAAGDAAATIAAAKVALPPAASRFLEGG
jgi:uncharacterized protein